MAEGGGGSNDASFNRPPTESEGLVVLWVGLRGGEKTQEAVEGEEVSRWKRRIFRWAGGSDRQGEVTRMLKRLPPPPSPSSVITVQ